MRKAPICDFCVARPAGWTHPAKDFVMPSGDRSVGSWAACDDCHELVESGLNALATRIVDNRPDKKIPAAVYHTVATILVRRFRAAQDGPSHRINLDDLINFHGNTFVCSIQTETDDRCGKPSTHYLKLSNATTPCCEACGQAFMESVVQPSPWTLEKK